MPQTLVSTTPLQQQALPPVIKRVIPEGYDYRIIIPENVEYIIRKFCEKAPDNEWSGTLFYEFEGDFDSPSFKIICKDFFLMDLGSSAFTEFTEDGTAIDYMVENPELLNCQMGLMHSHDRMATFFSGTDVQTLRTEGSDRNNFVSLIVNNAGSYTAAITRKVEYTEKHDIEITGKYPFFGTRRMCEIPAVHSVDEKKKTVIEYFEITVEKESVVYNPDKYDAMFNRVIAKKTKPATPSYNKTHFPYSDMSSPYYGGGSVYGSYYGSLYGGVSERTETKKEEDKKPEIAEVFKDEDTFELSFVKEALATDLITYKFRELILQVLTGCPIISKWVKSAEVNNSLLEEVMRSMETTLGTTEYKAFVYSYLENVFVTNEPEAYFPNRVITAETPTFTLENILLIKMIDMLCGLEANSATLAIIEALKEFYSV